MKHASKGFNAYQVLGLPRTATSEEIRKAYLALAKKWHPDVCDHPEALPRFQEIQAAYESIKDAEGKEIYDAIESAEESKSTLANYRKQQAARREEAKKRRGKNFGGGGGWWR